MADKTAKPAPIVVHFDLDRLTKNTARYAENAGDGPEIIGTLYLQKHAIGTPAPERVTVTIDR